MKLLKRMLLINWHYVNKQMIEFGNINFLTGKNASGKSTILDALQLLILGDTRGTFFNKAANDKAGRSLEGYLKGEIGDDGSTGYKYLRDDRFSTYIVCEFFDNVTRKNFCLGVIFDVYKDSEIENHFFFINGKIPDNEFVQDNNIPFSYKDLKSFMQREYGVKNFEVYASNKQYQDSARGKLGGLNQKFFNLFKKAVTFTPIDDIEKFIVEYVCDVKNKIDIVSMQENIRQYNNLSKQVEIMKVRAGELEEIQKVYNSYIEQISKQKEEQYLILRAEKQILLNEQEKLKSEAESKKIQKNEIEKATSLLTIEKNKLEEELTELTEIKAKSDIEAKRKELTQKIQDLNSKIQTIEKIEKEDINYLRNNNLRWNANILKLEQIKNKIVADELQSLNTIKDLIKYIETINENNFHNLEIETLKELKQKIDNLINLGNAVFFKTKQEQEEDIYTKKILESDISKLKEGINPYEPELINFKLELEEKLKEKIGKDINIFILADLLEIKDFKWQNAIEGYLNTQKKYLIIEPEYFEEASKIYRNLAKNNNKIHSFGLVDIEKIQKENNQVLPNSLAEEIITQNNLAKTYINYLLGRVIKCETIEELRNNKIAITPDCMLYQGYVLRKINPKFYMYPTIGKSALEKQKQIKEQELISLEQKMSNEEVVIKTMKDIKEMPIFNENNILNFYNHLQESNKKADYINSKDEIQKELDGMDLLWLNNISAKIDEKNKIKKEKEDLILENTRKMEGLRKEIEANENEKTPEIEQKLNEKCIQIEENYTKEWEESIGEEKYGKEALRKTAERIQEIFTRNLKSSIIKREEIKTQLEDKKSSYNTKYQLSYNIHDDSNKEFEQELKQLEEIELPKYTDKIEDSRKKAYEQFRIEFLDKLKSNIDEVKSQIKELNNALGEHKFGSDSYSFKVSPKQEYKRFYNMITDEMLLGDWEIGQEQFNQKYSEEIKELFNKITTTDVNNLTLDEYEKNIKEYTDYRTYLNFDLIVKDSTGNEQRLSKTLLKKSGGETQTPFYISVLASFAQVYRIKNNENTIRLIVFDEAFSKMDSERIEESIKILKKIGFQAIFAAPPDKLQDIQSLVDSTLLVINPEEHAIVVKKYTNKEEW